MACTIDVGVQSKNERSENKEVKTNELERCGVFAETKFTWGL